MRFCSIASGSSGNCIYVGSDNTHLLLDCGISGKRIENGVNSLGISPGEIDGILLTHEHTDHVQGLGVISRRYGIPIYATEGTIGAVKKLKNLGEIPGECFRFIRAGERFSVGDIGVESVRTSHDAAESVAFRFFSADTSAAVMTDLGSFDDSIVSALKGVNVLLLEANHDVRMLETGRYPYSLKCRIMGEKGHLSNDSAGELLLKILHDDLKQVFLGHLSRENNYPDLAYETVRMFLTMSDTPYRFDDFKFSVAKRDEMSECILI